MCIYKYVIVLSCINGERIGPIITPMDLVHSRLHAHKNCAHRHADRPGADTSATKSEKCALKKCKSLVGADVSTCDLSTHLCAHNSGSNW